MLTWRRHNSTRCKLVHTYTRTESDQNQQYDELQSEAVPESSHVWRSRNASLYWQIWHTLTLLLSAIEASSDHFWLCIWYVAQITSSLKRMLIQSRLSVTLHMTPIKSFPSCHCLSATPVYPTWVIGCRTLYLSIVTDKPQTHTTGRLDNCSARSVHTRWCVRSFTYTQSSSYKTSFTYYTHVNDCCNLSSHSSPRTNTPPLMW